MAAMAESRIIWLGSQWHGQVGSHGLVLNGAGEWNTCSLNEGRVNWGTWQGGAALPNG